MADRSDMRVQLARIDTYLLGARVAQGPLSSLAAMPVRRGCLVRVEDNDGGFGWGEIWCNFPPHGAESRAHLVADVIGPELLGKVFGDWSRVRPELEVRLARMMIHTGEAGAFAHCLAGIDMAVADLAARRAGQNMTEFLGGEPVDGVAVYASTPSGGALEQRCAQILALGHDAVKLKIGYDAATDRAAVALCRAALGVHFGLMVDANQAWTCDEAIAHIAALAPHGLAFVEEPLRADDSAANWLRLARNSPVELAAGENIMGESAFAAHVDAGSLGVVQPDVAKWGGVSGTLAVGRHARANGARCCMHFMGTGLGLSASLHLLAVIGGDGRVELDINENPLRADLGPIDLQVRNGALRLPQGPGFGFEPDAAMLRRLSTY
ncbi:MAG: mandelate racemase/muconate lactonizing enzyme family protein [Burkholderiaceae bacterium]